MTAHTKPPIPQAQIPNDLDAYWMPFTPNKRFKAEPRFVDRAEGMYYFTPDGRKLLDGASGLWCVSAGHCHPRIVEAIQRQAGELGYATNFNMGHPKAHLYLMIGAQVRFNSSSKILQTHLLLLQTLLYMTVSKRSSIHPHRPPHCLFLPPPTLSRNL